METEKVIYKTCPSQLVNVWPFAASALIFAAIIVASVQLVNNYLLLALIIPVIYALWRWASVQSTQLTITNERLIVSKGVLNKTTNETELYRVRDTAIEEPILLRVFGLGNIVVYTTDEALPTHTFTAYKKPHWVKDQIRNYAEECRQKKRWGNDNVLLHDHPF